MRKRGNNLQFSWFQNVNPVNGFCIVGYGKLFNRFRFLRGGSGWLKSGWSGWSRVCKEMSMRGGGERERESKCKKKVEVRGVTLLMVMGRKEEVNPTVRFQ